MAHLERLAVLLAVGAATLLPAPGGINSAAAAKERKSMDGLVIGTFPKQRAVLPGESLPVDTVFENPGSRPIDVPNAEGPSPFAYDVLKAADRTPAYEVSQDLRDTRRARDIAPAHDRPPQPLAAGETLHREEDLAELHNEDFAPGKYLLRARAPFEGPATTTSALSPFTVLEPRVESFSSGVCGNRKVLATVYAHRREDGGVLILQRESLTDPREGVAFRRVHLPPGPGGVQVAVALDAMVAGNGRWFGWLRDGVFEAAVGWGNRVVLRVPPAPIGDTQAVLLSPGFQVDVGVGLFGFVLNAQQGPARLTALRATSTGLKLAFDAELSPQPVHNVRWNYRPDAGVTVVWEDPIGQLVTRTFNKDGKPLQAAQDATGGLQPLAWELPALGEPALRAVVRTRDGRFLLDEPGAAAPLPLPLLATDAAAAPLAFAFCSPAPGRTQAVAVAAGKVWSSSLSGGRFGAWRSLADTRLAQHLHAFSPRGRTCWAEWVEGGVGTRRVALP